VAAAPVGRHGTPQQSAHLVERAAAVGRIEKLHFSIPFVARARSLVTRARAIFSLPFTPSSRGTWPTTTTATTSWIFGSASSSPGLDFIRDDNDDELGIRLGLRAPLHQDLRPVVVAVVVRLAHADHLPSMSAPIILDHAILIVAHPSQAPAQYRKAPTSYGEGSQFHAFQSFSREPKWNLSLHQRANEAIKGRRRCFENPFFRLWRGE